MASSRFSQMNGRGSRSLLLPQSVLYLPRLVNPQQGPPYPVGLIPAAGEDTYKSALGARKMM